MTIGTKLFAILSNGPESFKACEFIYVEGSEAVTFILRHLDPAALLGNIASNAWAHGMTIVTDAWSVINAFMSHDFYAFGKNFADVILLIFA